jgi:glycerol-3-phosphate dehydrogenase
MNRGWWFSTPLMPRRAPQALVNASGVWTRQVSETVLHLPAVQASFTNASQIVVREIFDRDCVYALQNDDRRMIYAISCQRDLTMIATSERGFDGEATLLTVLGAAKAWMTSAHGSAMTSPVPRSLI